MHLVCRCDYYLVPGRPLPVARLLYANKRNRTETFILYWIWSLRKMLVVRVVKLFLTIIAFANDRGVSIGHKMETARDSNAQQF